MLKPASLSLLAPLLQVDSPAWTVFAMVHPLPASASSPTDDPLFPAFVKPAAVPKLVGRMLRHPEQPLTDHWRRREVWSHCVYLIQHEANVLDMLAAGYKATL